LLAVPHSFIVVMNIMMDGYCGLQYAWTTKIAHARKLFVSVMAEESASEAGSDVASRQAHVAPHGSWLLDVMSAAPFSSNPSGISDPGLAQLFGGSAVEGSWSQGTSQAQPQFDTGQSPPVVDPRFGTTKRKRALVVRLDSEGVVVNVNLNAVSSSPSTVSFSVASLSAKLDLKPDAVVDVDDGDLMVDVELKGLTCEVTGRVIGVLAVIALLVVCVSRKVLCPYVVYSRVAWAARAFV
jgi:hypothetical protein